MSYPISEERKRVFLESLRETGSIHRAAAAATPHGTSKTEPGRSAFRELRQRDPDFELQVQEAIQDFLGKAEALVAERAFAPEVRRHYDRQGNLVGEDESYREANRLLTRVLAKHDPSWRESKNIDSTLQVSGGVSHDHLQLKMADLIHLSKPEQQQLLGLLEKVHAARNGEPVKQIEADVEGEFEDA